MNPNDDPVTFAKTVYEAYKKGTDTSGREQNPDYAIYMRNLERERLKQGDICADCPNLLLLTDQVNAVLQHMANDPNSDFSPRVLHEVNSLEGMFYFTKEENYSGMKTDGAPCKRFELMNRHDPFGDPDSFDEGNHVLIFSRNVNFDNISQVQILEPGKRKIFFFRGLYPDEDIVVRVIRDSKGNANVSYFKEMVSVGKENRGWEQLKNQNKALSQHNAKMAKVAEEQRQAMAKEDATRDKFNMEYGWNTEGSGTIPDKVTVLSIDGASHFETVSLTGGAEVSSKKQAANVRLSDKEGDDFVGLEANGNGDVTLSSRSDFESFAVTSQATQKGEVAVQLRDKDNKEIVELRRNDEGLAQLGVPMQFNIYDTGVIVDGKVVAGEDGSYGGTWVLRDRDSKTRYVDLNLNNDKEKTQVGVGHSQRFSNGTVIGVKVNQNFHNDGRSETAGWVQFSMPLPF